MTTQVAYPATPRAVLYHGEALSIDALEPALEAEHVHRQPPLSSLADLTDAPEAPSVLLLDETLARSTPELDDALERLPPQVAVVATGPAVAERADSPHVPFTLPADADTSARLRVLRAAFRYAATRLGAARTERELARTRAELKQLNRLGMALMTEREPDRLLGRILDQARRLTTSDAGSLYLVEETDAERRLRFKVSQNRSLPKLPFTEFTLPLDRSSVAGYSAVTGEPLVIEDVYHLPEETPFAFNRSFDERFGYRTRSMLVVPMKDHRGNLVGVLQLINRRTSQADERERITTEDAADRIVLPYTDQELEIVSSLAGHAAVSIENSKLYGQIEQIFESFVKAAVTAIDQRDPTTAGHSIRVATLTCDLAEVLDRHDDGDYAAQRFTREQMRELRYAALLHDFGKVGVREDVLIKPHKLPPRLSERVNARFGLIRRTMEAEYHRRRAELLEREDGDPRTAAALEEEFRRRLRELERFNEAVWRANKPTVLPEESAAVLTEIADRTFEDVDGSEQPYLEQEELRFLRIPQGSLDERERREIESHVEQTYRFLEQLPWTDDLRDVARIAYGHHEKLDGSGYPRGVTGEQIPVQTRVMTIADIFDALTARDRPYKRALSTESALDIIRDEARRGMLDPALVKMLLDSRVYRKVIEADWREL